MNGHNYNYSYVYGYTYTSNAFQLLENWYYDSSDCTGPSYELQLYGDHSNTCEAMTETSASITYITASLKPWEVYNDGLLEYYYLSRISCSEETPSAFIWYNNVCSNGMTFTCDSSKITITFYDTNVCTGSTIVQTQPFDSCSSGDDDAYYSTSSSAVDTSGKGKSWVGNGGNKNSGKGNNGKEQGAFGSNGNDGDDYYYYLPFEDAYTQNIITTSCVLNSNTSGGENQITVVYGIAILAAIIVGFAIAYVLVKRYLVPNPNANCRNSCIKMNKTEVPSDDIEMEHVEQRSHSSSTSATSKNPMINISNSSTSSSSTNPMQLEEKEKLFNKVSIEL